MFLSATHFPSPALTAQAFQGLSLCRLLLYPGQACGSVVTIGKGRSHHLHARKPCPHCISPCLLSPYLQVPKSVFFLVTAPALGTWGHPGSVSCGAVKGGKVSLSLPAVSRKKGGYGVRQSGNPGLRNPSGGFVPLSPIIFGCLSYKQPSDLEQN